MTLITLIFLAFAMSMDAFAVALAKGAILQRPSFVQALKIGGLFGLIEGITPLVGWLIGTVAHQWIEQIDHWIAFILLVGLGLKALYDAFFGEDDEQQENETLTKQSRWLLVLTAIGTSLDAMTVGITLAFLTVNIVLASLFIGLATTIMATSGILLGRLLGEKIGKSAEVFGGIVLIIIGSSILIEHLKLF